MKFLLIEDVQDVYPTASVIFTYENSGVSVTPATLQETEFAIVRFIKLIYFLNMICCKNIFLLV